MTTSKNSAISKSKEDLTSTQLNFLRFCQQFGWGKLEVTVVNGEPVGSKELERTYRHDINTEYEG